MSQFKEKLEAEIKAHNELHNQVQAGEEQLQAMKAELERRRGRIGLLQELHQQDAESAEVAPDGQPEG